VLPLVFAVCVQGGARPVVRPCTCEEQ
jgi:hypothetical protein